MLDDFFAFLEKSPTSYHANQEICNRLKKEGFSPLDLKDNWELEKEKGYYVCYGSFLAAFCVPKKIERLSVLASHTDSPALKLKPNPQTEFDHLSKLSTAIYGGPIYSTWTNRDLGIAGKIVYTNHNGELESSLVNIDNSPVFVCQPAIHIHKSINDEGINASKLKPIFSLDKDVTVEKLLKKHVPFKRLIDFDLYLYPLEKPRVVGIDQSLISAYRLDNLTSVFTSLDAIINSQGENSLSAAIFYDHEEIGSRTMEGASFTLFDEILEKIVNDHKKIFALKKEALCLSCDLSHGYDPEYKDKFDLTNSTYLGKGVVIKYDARKSYSTSIEGAAILQMIAEKNNLPLQKFHNKSGSRSGSTIGPIFESEHGIKTVDVGLGCLSMHGAKEIISIKDFEDQVKLLGHFLKEPYHLGALL